MKTTLILFAAMAFFQTVALQSTDLDALTQKKWVGTLTYLDYTANKRVSIETALTVERSVKAPGVYVVSTSYPKEPSHNSTDETVISKDGSRIDDETVKERTVLADGTLRILTAKEGEDNNRPATLRYTYLVGKTHYSRKKEVCYKGTTAWFTRNELHLTAQ